MKNVTGVFVLALALFLAPVTVLAEQETSGAVHLNLGIVAWSQYVRSDGGVAHRHPVLQTDLYFSLPRGFYFDVWHSAGMEDANLSSDFADEIDYTAGWSGRLRGLRLDMGFGYYDVHKLLDSPRGDVMELFVNVSRQLDVSMAHNLTPWLKLQRPMPARGDRPNGGTMISAGMDDSWRVRNYLTINHGAGLLYGDGTFDMDQAVIGKYHTELVWSVSKNVAVKLPMLKISSPLTSVSDNRETEVVVGGGFAVHF